MVGEVDEADETPIPLGQSKCVRAGDDVTVVTWSAHVGVCDEAAATVAERGIGTDLIDLRTLWPWDRDAVFASVEQTGRLVVVHEAVQVGGFGGEIAAEVSEHLFAKLRAPVRRLGGARIPIPFSRPLEENYKIHAADVVALIEDTVGA